MSCDDPRIQLLSLVSMRILRSFFLTFMFACAAAATLCEAQAPNTQDCSTATSTAAMRACENARFTKADQDLKTVYDQLNNELDSPARMKLASSQTAWRRFRDTNAAFQAAAASGGTLAPLLKITMLADMTEARSTELRKLLK